MDLQCETNSALRLKISKVQGPTAGRGAESGFRESSETLSVTLRPPVGHSPIHQDKSSQGNLHHCCMPSHCLNRHSTKLKGCNSHRRTYRKCHEVSFWPPQMTAHCGRRSFFFCSELCWRVWLRGVPAAAPAQLPQIPENREPPVPRA